mmetsp:Transcript_47330/g.126642  ORF Transcript_47330/g.126642 Transcript_47330/m.126642 type:complete len:226 (+) Transcript_47330:822-1499(+)
MAGDINLLQCLEHTWAKPRRMGTLLRGRAGCCPRAWWARCIKAESIGNGGASVHVGAFGGVVVHSVPGHSEGVQVAGHTSKITGTPAEPCGIGLCPTGLRGRDGLHGRPPAACIHLAQVLLSEVEGCCGSGRRGCGVARKVAQDVGRRLDGDVARQRRAHRCVLADVGRARLSLRRSRMRSRGCRRGGREALIAENLRAQVQCGWTHGRRRHFPAEVGESASAKV